MPNCSPCSSNVAYRYDSLTVVSVTYYSCVHGLSMDDAMVRGRSRKLIRMVDEQEGCEWMNVFSGTGSPW